MRYLIVSDVHGNREALEAVLKDSRGKYERAVSCGDLCDYGPDSNYVIDWARTNVAVGIRGNHDRVCAGLDNLERFTDLAQASARWTMEQLTPANRSYLRELPHGPRVADESLVLVHGSPRDEDEYVTNMNEVGEVFSFLAVNPVPGMGDLPFFFGHTHLQGVFVRAEGRTRRVSPPLDPTSEARIGLEPGSAYLINPGSVGQPRDGDPRAGYAIFDSRTREVLLRRVPYNHAATERKILAAGLPPRLAVRLGFGR
jgi:diadenosine tetraphosphatase ApaH/serine/threonine PP2A family protein phosphatase